MGKMLSTPRVAGGFSEAVMGQFIVNASEGAWIEATRRGDFVRQVRKYVDHGVQVTK